MSSSNEEQVQKTSLNSAGDSLPQDGPLTRSSGEDCLGSQKGIPLLLNYCNHTSLRK